MLVQAYDRDGTLTSNDISEIYRPGDLVLTPLALAMTGPAIIVSNQRGILKRYKTVTNLLGEMRYLMGRLPIVRAYFCPDNGESVIWCSRTDWGQVWTRDNNRKGGAGMFRFAEAQGFKSTCYFGDYKTDRYAAAAYGVPFVDAKQYNRAITELHVVP